MNPRHSAGGCRYDCIAGGYPDAVSSGLRQLLRVGVLCLSIALVATGPVAAQTVGESFCETEMALTVKNMFTIIQFGGPLLGGLIALGATVMLPAVGTEKKKEMKQLRNQGLIWGVLVAPLGTAIISFLLNNVVAGGASCGF
jgi:hypothetical protein